jgi:hypothetical protein
VQQTNAFALGGVHVIDNRFIIAGTRVTGTGSSADPIRQFAALWIAD